MSDICSAGGTSTGASGWMSASASCPSESPIGWRWCSGSVGHRESLSLSWVRRRPFPRMDWIILASGVHALT